MRRRLGRSRNRGGLLERRRNIGGRGRREHGRGTELRRFGRHRRAVSLSSSNVELERKVAERTLQLENERLRIEALLRDVNHRVGNNLAMVSALLNVQSRQTREPAVKQALAQAQSRIQAIAAGQRRLRLDIEADEIEARPYLEDLLAEIGKAAEGRPIEIVLAMDAIRLPGRDAVSFVVVINELVTNAIKHAFPDGAGGRITISLVRTPEENLVLSVEDDGVGMPEDQETAGLGKSVINALLRSMRASLDAAPLSPGAARPGTRVAVTFPRREQPLVDHQRDEGRQGRAAPHRHQAPQQSRWLLGPVGRERARCARAAASRCAWCGRTRRARGPVTVSRR